MAVLATSKRSGPLAGWHPSAEGLGWRVQSEGQDRGCRRQRRLTLSEARRAARHRRQRGLRRLSTMLRRPQPTALGVKRAGVRTAARPRPRAAGTRVASGQEAFTHRRGAWADPEVVRPTPLECLARTLAPRLRKGNRTCAWEVTSGYPRRLHLRRPSKFRRRPPPLPGPSRLASQRARPPGPAPRAVL